MCKLDHKIAMFYKLITMPFAQMAVMLYPRIYPITDLTDTI